jgi:hypothetical protein
MLFTREIGKMDLRMVLASKDKPMACYISDSGNKVKSMAKE